MQALTKVLAILAATAMPTGSAYRYATPKAPLPGSQQRYVHYSSKPLHLSNKRSRDRAARRSGEISARQQRILRKQVKRAYRVLLAY